MHEPVESEPSIDPRRSALLQARRDLTRRFAVPPLAWSANGHTFGFQAPLTAPSRAGTYVRISADDGVEYLGQITDSRLTERDGPDISADGNAGLDVELAGGRVSSASFRLRIRQVEGGGTLLGRVTPQGIVPTTDADLFEDAAFERAPAEDVDRYLDGRFAERVALDIGTVADGDGAARARLLASGFDRHTFLCGQSGSGKTYSLGLILERILLETELPLVIIDPNSDFVRLGDPRSFEQAARGFGDDLTAEHYAALRERYEAAAERVRVFRPVPRGQTGDRALRIRFSDLAPTIQGLVLRIDPLRDREEYHMLRVTIERLGRERYSIADIQAAATASLSEDSLALARRIANLGVAGWDVWAEADEPSIADAGTAFGDARALVFDVGGFGTAEEKSLIATATLGAFWNHRERREPVLIVIDEAHNVCAQEPADPLQAAATERAIRFAGEGRKFGLYLLMSSQRPQKIHSNVLSQCDNLVLMRMNSASDLAQLAEVFSFVPASLMERASAFRQGESLVAGKIVPSPLLVRFGGRISQEGGSDVPTTWAAPRLAAPGGDR
jgi:DNA helicase HerA-like ATPase